MASYGLHGSSFVRLPEPRPTQRSNASWSRPKVDFFGGRFTKCRCTAALGMVSDGCSNFQASSNSPYLSSNSNLIPPRFAALAYSRSFLSNTIFPLTKKHCTRGTDDNRLFGAVSKNSQRRRS